MILDGHIHIGSTAAKPEPLMRAMREAQVDGGIILSAMPRCMSDEMVESRARLAHVMDFCSAQPLLFPFFFIDPTEEDALSQVDDAVSAGVAGFKIICTHFFPSDSRCLAVCERIAKHQKPLMFHSGILWNGLAASGEYNRPVAFEKLLTIPGLRFALAHISWPWTDECTAVYGKFDNATRQGHPKITPPEMFIDNTPGTPKVYRKDALTRLLLAGYEISRNMYFGSDNVVEQYNVEWVRDWLQTDSEIYKGLSLDADAIAHFHAKNLLRFVGEQA